MCRLVVQIFFFFFLLSLLSPPFLEVKRRMTCIYKVHTVENGLAWPFEKMLIITRTYLPVSYYSTVKSKFLFFLLLLVPVPEHRASAEDPSWVKTKKGLFYMKIWILESDRIRSVNHESEKRHNTNQKNCHRTCIQYVQYIWYFVWDISWFIAFAYI